MRESKKAYDKAVEYFDKGELEKALKYLEDAISVNMKNAAALNLKGMIYYLIGDGKKAYQTWRVNIEVNDDDMAKTYIREYQNNRENEEYYKLSLVKIKEGRIREATEFLERATSSNFNIINIRNTLSYCYIKQKNYSLAKKNALKVLEKDCKNKIANDNLEFIKKEIGEVKEKKGINKKLLIASCAVVAVGSIAYVSIFNNLGEKKVQNNNVQAVIDVPNEKHDKKQDDNIEVSENDLDKKVENSNSLKAAVDKKDYVLISKILNDDFKAENKEQELLEKTAIEMMKTDGAKKLYDEGISLFNSNNFGKAINMFLSAYEYSKGIYLEEHIVYMTALAYEKSKNIDDALKYYEIYANASYEEDAGGYLGEALYKIATLSNDKDKQIKYAKRVRNEFKDSIYNNDYINMLLK